ncbi:MAG: 30S ribosomal protein S1 [Candidatus Omnitrophica bacterium CG11_big_fil_rev_8_21_14_0_20_64_10]|nr:MAG: 30S ribosomal protein S1 [Candidatus Omnitrophica bacterium CG11_big_fil_rev_8_21_14_0_20_64_10]
MLDTFSTTQGADSQAVLDREELAKYYEESIKSFKEGEIVQGRVIALRGGQATIDIGYKSEGMVDLSEFDEPASVKVGDPVEVLLESVENEDGLVVLSKRKAERVKGWERLFEKSGEGDMVDGRIARKVKGGLMVDVEGVEAFLPASQVFLRGFGNLDALVGQVAKVTILKVNKARKNIVVSRKEALIKERDSLRQKLIEELEIGQVRQGVVKNITDFGAFISLGGVDGLLHITDMSWGRVGHPSEVVSVGQKLDVMVLGFDRESLKISLGLKQLQPNPWDKVEEKYPVGTRIEGRVVSLMPYGAFVELEKGLEGLVHVSELSWTRRPAHPNEMLKEGQVVPCVVLSADRENQKIALGIKQTEPNPWEAFVAAHPIGSQVTGKVQHLTDYGAFVNLAEGIDGLLHVQDLSWTRRVGHPSELLNKGDEIQVQIISADPANQKVGLSLKALTEDPWAGMADRYPAGTLVDGKVTKIAGFGLFIEIEKDLDGLAHLSELPVKLPANLKKGRRGEDGVEEGASSDSSADPVVEFLERQYKVGDPIQARVIRVDTDQRRIALSLKRV